MSGQVDEVQAFLRDYVGRGEKVELLIVARDWRAQQGILGQLGQSPKSRYGSTVVLDDVRVKVAHAQTEDAALCGWRFDAALVHVDARAGLLAEIGKRLTPRRGPVRLFGGAS